MPIASAASAAALALSAAAAPPHVHQYMDLALSPRGDLIAAVESADRAASAKRRLVVRRLDGQVVSDQPACEGCAWSGLAWSPDGKALALVSVQEKTGVQSLLVSQAGKLRTVASFKGLLATPRWSPDGSTLAVLATANPHKLSGATQPGAARVGDLDAAPDERRIAVVPASGGEIRLVSPADKFVYEYDWTPDGRGFVATDAVGDGDNNWWVAKLEAVDLATGAARVIAAPKLQMDYPRVSPDGKTVAFIGGLMSDFGSSGGDLYTVPFAGGEPTDVSSGFKGTFTSLSWKPSGLFAAALVGDREGLFQATPEGRLTPLWSDQVSIRAGDGRAAFSADGRIAATVAESFTAAPHVVAGPVRALKTVTHDNDALASNLSAGSVHWKSDGFDVQGWLLGPKTLAPGKTYPMAVQVHGGPGAAHEPRFTASGTVYDLVQHGYFVFMPNPRGSFGQGEAFTRANVQDFGGGDLRDILAGVDAVEKAAPVDDKRLAIFGHSYGGFMTMWAVTHTNRFHAAVAGAGIANWISYYGENGIDQWMVPFFGGTAYDNPAVYDRLSPIRSIKQAKTPTFIYVGELDVECPPAQSIEFWHGMKAMGVPTSLIIYPGEGHGIRKPADVKDIEDRTIGWFDKYLGG